MLGPEGAPVERVGLLGQLAGRVEAALGACGVGEVDHGQDRLVRRRAEDAPLPLQGLLEERPGLRRAALIEQQLAQAVHGPERVLVVGAEDSPECL